MTSIPSFMSSGRAPKEDMASTMKILPRAFTARAMSAMGFTMPDVVSQWMTQTWLIAGSASRAGPLPRGVGAALSPLSILMTGRPRRVRIAAARSP